MTSKTGWPPQHSLQWLFKIPWCWRRGTETLAQTAQQHCPLWCSPLHGCHAWWKGLCHPTSLQQAATRLHFLKQCPRQSQSVTQCSSDCNFVNIGLSYNLTTTKSIIQNLSLPNPQPQRSLWAIAEVMSDTTWKWTYIFILLLHSIHTCQCHMPSSPFLNFIESLRWDFYCA